MHARGLLLAALLGLPLLAVLPGAAADVGVGYRADAPDSASVDGTDLHTYALEIEVEAAEGEDVVNLTAGYRDLGSGAIAPPTDLTLEDPGSGNARTLGSISSFEERTTPLQVVEGKHVLRAEVAVPNVDGNRTTYLEIGARSPTESASSANAVYDLTYEIRRQGLDVVAPDGAVEADAGQAFEVDPTGGKPVRGVALLLDDAETPLQPAGGGTYAGTVSTCGTTSYRFEVTYEDGRSLRVPSEPVNVTPPEDPEADLAIDPASPEAGDEIAFEAQAQGDDACPLSSWSWSLGDGIDAEGSTVRHTYDQAGTYDVTLVVSQRGGKTDAVTRTLTIASPSGDETQEETGGQEAPPLEVTDLSFREDGTEVTVDVTTNREANGTLVLEGPGGPTTRSLGPGTDLSATVDLRPDETYGYTLRLQPDAGLEVRRTGTYRLSPAGTSTGVVTKVPAPAALAESVRAAAGDADVQDLYLADVDGDGGTDRIEGAGGLATERAIPSRDLYLTRTPDADLVLVDAAAGEAHPAAAMEATVVGVEAGEGTANVTLEVPAKDGWISVTAPDRRPDAPIDQVTRADGKTVPEALAWREDGTLRFLDDPSTRYHVLYEVATTEDASGIMGLPIPGPGAFVAVVLAVAALAANRRRRGNP